MALAALGTCTRSAASTIETQQTGVEQQHTSLKAISCYSEHLPLCYLPPKCWDSIGVCMSWDIWGMFSCIPMLCWDKLL